LGTKIYQHSIRYMERDTCFEMRHPRCVGSVTKNFFIYYTYSRTQLYFI